MSAGPSKPLSEITVTSSECFRVKSVWRIFSRNIPEGEDKGLQGKEESLTESELVRERKHYFFFNTNFGRGWMLSFGRGSGVSFRAAALSVSDFKADITIAFLSLFPRSRITEMKEIKFQIIDMRFCKLIMHGCLNKPEMISLVGWFKGFTAVWLFWDLFVVGIWFSSVSSSSLCAFWKYKWSFPLKIL